MHDDDDDEVGGEEEEITGEIFLRLQGESWFFGSFMVEEEGKKKQPR